MLTFYLANPVPTLMTVLFLTLILVCTSQEECVHVLLFIGEFFIFGMKIRALVRAGAMGARAPADFWQRVPSTRPDRVQYYKP